MGMKLFGKKGCDFSESWPLLTSLQHPRYLPRNAEKYFNCIKANENSMHLETQNIYHQNSSKRQTLSIFIHFYPLFIRYFNGFLEVANFILLFCFCLGRRGGSRGAGADMADSDESEYLEESESEEMSDEAWSARKRRKKRVNEAVFNLATKKRQLEIKMVAAVGLF